VVVALTVSLAVSGCVTTSESAESLTPAQRELRQQTERFNETVAIGAAVGAGLGCALGLLVDSRNRGRGCAAGAALGGLAGAGSGYYIASRNEQYASREQGANARAAAARKEAEDLSRTADVAERVTRENKAQLAQLDAKFRAGQITAAQYRDQTAAMREDAKTIRRASEEAGKVSGTMSTDGGDGVRQQATRVAQAQRRLDSSARELEQALDRVPAA
jgi:hypothetical protein